MWGLVALAVALTAGLWMWSSRRVGEAEQRAKRIERQADSLAVAYQGSKRQVESAQALSRQIAMRAREDGLRLRQQIARAQDVTDSLRADTSDAVLIAIAHSDSLATATASYVSLIDTLLERHASERRLMAAALADADSLIAVQNALNAALRAERCRVWGRPCPSRSQAFIGGALLVALLVIR